jgi:hypothetical protein
LLEHPSESFLAQLEEDAVGQHFLWWVSQTEKEIYTNLKFLLININRLHWKRFGRRFALQGIEFCSNVFDEEEDLAIEASETAEMGRPPEHTSKFYAMGSSSISRSCVDANID